MGEAEYSLYLIRCADGSLYTGIAVDVARRLEEHQSGGRGDFVARITADTTVANRAHAMVFGAALQDLMQVVFALGMAFWVSWQQDWPWRRNTEPGLRF
ncbi:MAG: GIY-YIG nuclease family protein [Pseudomonadota bacterium]